MRTDDFVTMLATNAGAAERYSTERRFAYSMGVGAVCSLVLMLSLLGARNDIVTAISLPMFWIKFAFLASLCAASMASVSRLSRPGRTLGILPVVFAAPVLVIWGLGVAVLANADPEQRLSLVVGQTWSVCAFLIAMLSLPFLIATFWAVKGLAPTNLPLAGGAAGLLAGSSGALIYSFHCPEMDAPFLGIWYVLGILIPTFAGAILGSRFLRW